MNWADCISYFFGGIFMANAIPHLISGMTGRAFQSPFAKPSGEGLSSSTVNVVWGAFNIVIGYLLIFQVGTFDIRNLNQIGPAGVGALAISLFSAHHFGRFHGGRSPVGKFKSTSPEP